MVLEAHRYQIHEVWRSRLRLLEENFIANLLDPESSIPRRRWMKVLSNDLREPEHKLTLLAAVTVRLRRIYIWIFTTIVLSWLMKLTIHPTPAESLSDAIERAAIGFIPGMAVVIALLLILLLLAILSVVGFYPLKEKREGEVLEEEPGYEWRRKEEGEEDEDEK